MNDDKDDLKRITVYKFNNTKESWHEYALKFRVIADRKAYEDVIDGTKTPPDEKQNLEILRQKRKSWQQEWPTKRVMETW